MRILKLCYFCNAWFYTINTAAAKSMCNAPGEGKMFLHLDIQKMWMWMLLEPTGTYLQGHRRACVSQLGAAETQIIKGKFSSSVLIQCCAKALVLNLISLYFAAHRISETCKQTWKYSIHLACTTTEFVQFDLESQNLVWTSLFFNSLNPQRQLPRHCFK